MAQATMMDDPATASAIGPWSCCSQAPGIIVHPEQLPESYKKWLPASVPGTVAEALQASGRWDMDHPVDLDGQDWWYRATFASPPAGRPCCLCFDGLASLVEVWLNGQRILSTNNMFRAYRIDVAHCLREKNELVLVFRSLTAELQKKRARPRWKTNLVNHQQLRWQRTSLLGRIPGWSPPVPPVGPWRAVRLDTRPFTFTDLRVCGNLEGTDGVVTLRAHLESPVRIKNARLEVAGQTSIVAMQAEPGGWLLHASLRIPHAPLWWPHTHGKQPLVTCVLHLEVEGEPIAIPCGNVGFRHLLIDREPGFGIRINGIPVYCRGACWTVNDIMTLVGSEKSLERELFLARDAGANMVRVGGTMAYESDAFYRLCDELGIMVWQDFMFANMDYPVDDPHFAANIETEAKQQLARLSAHPCIVIYCGNSEVEQQAAMVGVDQGLWRNQWFGGRLAELCAEYNPAAAYVASSPSGGALPFHVGDGIAHYYGVGAYLRSPRELRQANVKFAPECLAFANLPEQETVNAFMADGAQGVQRSRWKERVPRDTGAGWDFEDVRDFYLQYLFSVDPVKLRSFDMPRYQHLSRIVPGEMMARVFAEWRSDRTQNRGGLVWFFKDLWPAAGWGIVDSLGIPKAAYYYLRRSWLCRQLTITDEGLDGLRLHVTNENADQLNGRVEILLLKDDHIVIARNDVPCQVSGRGQRSFCADTLLSAFHDVTYSYRFGPPKHDVVIATLFDEEHRVLSEAYHFVRPCEPTYLAGVKIEAEAEPLDGGYQVVVQSDRFLRSVHLEAREYLPEDNYFHLSPGHSKRVRFISRTDGAMKFRATLEALNLKDAVGIRMKSLVS
jgi:beta-mannosidase